MQKTYSLNKSDALLVTDIQKDFLKGGALPVPQGNEIIPVINDYLRRFKKAKLQVFASRDWHPADHMSFKSQGGIWPPHCIQNTSGAEFHPDLKLPSDTVIVSKATDPKKESYSAFDGTALSESFKENRVERFFICGVATDYCVVNTVVDGKKLGLKAVVLMDAVRGINVMPNDVDEAVKLMLQSGAEQAVSDNFPDDADSLPVEEAGPDSLAEKPSARNAMKKKARMRPKGSAKRVASERNK